MHDVEKFKHWCLSFDLNLKPEIDGELQTDIDLGLKEKPESDEETIDLAEKVNWRMPYLTPCSEGLVITDSGLFIDLKSTQASQSFQLAEEFHRFVSREFNYESCLSYEDSKLLLLPEDLKIKSDLRLFINRVRVLKFFAINLNLPFRIAKDRLLVRLSKGVVCGYFKGHWLVEKRGRLTTNYRIKPTQHFRSPVKFNNLQETLPTIQPIEGEAHWADVIYNYLNLTDPPRRVVVDLLASFRLTHPNMFIFNGSELILQE